MRRAHAAPIFVLVSVAVAFGACSIYDSSLLLPAAIDAATPDAATADADTAPDTGVDTGLLHEVPPPPPTTEDGTANDDFVLAMSALRFLPNGTFSQSHPQAPHSYDLDNAYTCPGPESCEPISTQAHCDGDGGVDDSAGNLFQMFATLSSTFNDDTANNRIRSGAYSILFRVKGYNGGQNDKQVSVVVYLSNGVNGWQDGGTPAPLLDGTDVWTLDTSSLLGGNTVDGGPTCEGNDDICLPVYLDTKAYVSGGVLVAHLDFPLALGAGTSSLEVSLTDTVVTGTIVRAGDLYRVDEGQVAGRWNTAQFLTALQGVPDPVNTADYLCGTNGTYQNVKNLVCRGADVTTDPAKDNTGAPCDAISLAVAFSAAQAHLGPIFGKVASPGACGASWKDDCSSVK